jgi:hypothetical protein
LGFSEAILFAYRLLAPKPIAFDRARPHVELLYISGTGEFTPSSRTSSSKTTFIYNAYSELTNSIKWNFMRAA